MNVTIFAGTRPGTNPAHCEAARALGAALAAHGCRVIFGGGRQGVMGALANAALEGGADVLAVVPQFIAKEEILHPGVGLLVLPDMLARKAYMLETADAVCVLSGGLGTLDEAVAALTLRQLRRHTKPIVLLNTAGYWDTLLTVLETMFSEHFLHEEHHTLLTVVTDPAGALAAITEQNEMLSGERDSRA